MSEPLETIVYEDGVKKLVYSTVHASNCNSFCSCCAGDWDCSCNAVRWEHPNEDVSVPHWKGCASFNKYRQHPECICEFVAGGFNLGRDAAGDAVRFYADHDPLGAKSWGVAVAVARGDIDVYANVKDSE